MTAKYSRANGYLLKAIAVSSISCLVAFTQEIAKTIPSVFSISDKTSYPVFSNGYFLSHARTVFPGRSDVIYLTSEVTGQQTILPFSIPGASATRLERGTVMQDGSIVLAGSFASGLSGPRTIRNLGDPISTTRVTNFMATVSSTGQLQSMINLGDFTAERVCSVGDGTIWMFGQMWAEDFKGRQGKPYQMLRHVDATGTTIAAFLPKSIVTPGPIVNYRPKTASAQAAFLSCNKSLVVVYVERPVNGAIIDEIDIPTGREAYQLIHGPPTSRLSGFTITSDGRYFGSFRPLESSAGVSAPSSLYSLLGTFGVHHWQLAGAQSPVSPDFGDLVGLDGQMLVHLVGTAKAGTAQVYWSVPPAVH
jgi:hypothetical protein